MKNSKLYLLQFSDWLDGGSVNCSLASCLLFRGVVFMSLWCFIVGLWCHLQQRSTKCLTYFFLMTLCALYMKDEDCRRVHSPFGLLQEEDTLLYCQFHSVVLHCRAQVHIYLDLCTPKYSIIDACVWTEYTHQLGGHSVPDYRQEC